MPQNKPNFFELLASSHRSAVHLEMRDVYGVGDEVEDFERWKQTGQRDSDPASEYWRPWVKAISEAVSRGVEVRRARIVSEPVTDYIRYEHAGTVANLAAGEQVRWLPRHTANHIALPANDFWLFDDTHTLFNYFSGNGDWTGQELTSNPETAKLCGTAFEAAWENGTPHNEYNI